MAGVDQARSAAEIGSSLTAEDVDRLRQALQWVRSRHGLRVKDLAQNCDADIHTVHNFVAGKSQRPASAFLGRLYCYLRTHQWLLPDGFLDGKGQPTAPAPPAASPSRRLLSSAGLQGLLPIDSGDNARVRERYCGRYLCFARSYMSPGSILVAFLNIMAPHADAGRDRLPRFTMFIKYPDRIDPEVGYSYVIMGVAISRGGLIYLLGHHDGGLRTLTLSEPALSTAKYLQGVALLASIYDRQPFATRVVCERLPPAARRREWLDRLGLFDEAGLREGFANAGLVLQGLGAAGVLSASPGPSSGGPT
jgi:hypothetical protein